MQATERKFCQGMRWYRVNIDVVGCDEEGKCDEVYMY